MKSLLSLFLAPTFALSAATGSVTLLDGTPVSGAVIKNLTDSVTTSASGSFVLGRTTGIASRSAKTIPVSSHLVIVNGRPRLSFAGMDIAGRARSSAIARQNLSSTGTSFAARPAGTPDTLKVYWKGKRLTVLPVTSDTTVTFRIDTAWKDDAGIPWNPSVAYGSLYDARDGQTYRTVTIGSQTWMAENLNYAWGEASNRYCSDQNPSIKLCRSSANKLYSWSEAMKIDTAYDRIVWQGASNEGICPNEWHIPSYAEWNALFPTDSVDGSSEDGSSEYTYGTAFRIRSASALNESNLDSSGFRIIPAPIELFTNDTLYETQVGSTFWSSTQNPSPIHQFTAGIQAFYSPVLFVTDTGDSVVTSRLPAATKRFKTSLRCLKD